MFVPSIQEDREAKRGVARARRKRELHGNREERLVIVLEWIIDAHCTDEDEAEEAVRALKEKEAMEKLAREEAEQKQRIEMARADAQMKAAENQKNAIAEARLMGAKEQILQQDIDKQKIIDQKLKDQQAADGVANEKRQKMLQRMEEEAEKLRSLKSQVEENRKRYIIEKKPDLSPC